MKPIKVRGEGVGLKCRTAAAAECGCMGSMVNQYPALLCGLPPALPASGPAECPVSPQHHNGDRAGGQRSDQHDGAAK